MKKSVLRGINWNLTINCVLLCAVFLLYYLLNLLTPLWCDDLDYACDGRTLRAIWNKESFDYLYHSGRFFSHSTVQFFAGILGKGFFNFANASMTLLLILGVSVFWGPRKQVHVSGLSFFFLISLSLFLVWFFLPDQYITMFMIAGSSNYIWAAVLNLVFILLFMKEVGGEHLKGKGIQLVAFILSFFAGTWMEMYSIAVLPACGLLFIVKKGWKNRVAMGMIVLYAVGAAIVTFAPGNFVRHGDAVSSRPGLFTWCINQLEIAIRSGLVWVWLWIVAIFLIRFFRQHYTFKQFLSDTFVFQVAILFSYAFIFVSGVTSYRVGWGISIFSFVILFILLQGLTMPDSVYGALALLALTGVLIDFSSEYKVLRLKNAAVNEMVHQLKNNDLKDNHCFLWPEVPYSRKSIPDPVGEEGNWPGEFVARYYQSPSFSIVPKEAYRFCKGERQVDSLFCDKIPCVGSLALFRLNDGDGHSVTVQYEYNENRYVFRSSIARLVSALGFEGLVRESYGSPHEILGGKWLLERMESVQISRKLSMEDGQYNGFHFGGNSYLAVPLRDLLAPFSDPISICILE